MRHTMGYVKVVEPARCDSLDVCIDAGSEQVQNSPAMSCGGRLFEGFQIPSISC
jgi:hypothetical protein